MPSTRNILETLIGFDTTSRNSNMALMEYISGVLHDCGQQTELVPNDDQSKANLYCTIGPQDKAGVMLSGHTDVVPVDGQDWTFPPFTLTEADGRYYGRGTTDMKGYVASALAAACTASTRSLKTPLHLAFSYDEEIGCVGVRSLIEVLDKSPIKPAMCIVGEPTNLAVATRHKGKASVLVQCIGREAHSALAPGALNAIHLACEFVTAIRAKQHDIETAWRHANGASGDDPSEVPYTTVHVGRIVTTQALNIVPRLCQVNFEIRHTADDDPSTIIEALKTEAKAIVAPYKDRFPEASIAFEIINAYPALDTPTSADVVSIVKKLVGANTTGYVAFGTEAGLFSERLGIPTVVCGPGSMEQGHKPDEYIDIEQLNRCDDMHAQLIDWLEQH